VSTATSASRFDERRRFTGVYQQTSRVLLDSDWNEEIRIQVNDARRRTADVARGSPDDGFLIADTFVVDRVLSTSGWQGTPLDPSDERYIPPQLTLDRYEPEGLPFVVKSRGNTAVRRTLATPLNLAAVPLASEGATFIASALVINVRFEVPANEEEDTDVQLLLVTSSGDVTISLNFAELPSAWTELRFTAAQLQLLGVSTLLGWGLVGLPPRTTTRIDSLKVASSSLPRADFVIRGGDGTVTGAGRMLAGGVRAFLESDIRYRAQPDLPLLPPLPTIGTSDHFFVYLDVWELPITVLDDPFLIEPALDGLDTTTRERVVAQVKVALITGDGPEILPEATGAGALTTVFAEGDATPLRYPLEKPDACRDRCLFTESIATGKGYRGTDNVHVRLQVHDVDGRRSILWSRENAAVVVHLAESAAAGAAVVTVPLDEADKLSAGDLVLFEDRLTRLGVPGPHAPVLRRIRAIDSSTGTIELESLGASSGLEADPLPVGGPLPTAFDKANGASLRRFDGADWIEKDVRYNLPDGIDFSFKGTPSDFRAGDYWSFTARIHEPDGAAIGKVQELLQEPPHGPVHRYVPLARIREPASGPRVFEDIRPRFLPLTEVRDRLIELGRAQASRGPFVVVVGDGKITHGDIDQDEVEGITGDEAIQAAIRRVGKIGGGTVYIRAGAYVLERPILLTGVSNVRLLGDGAATRITSINPGGAIWADQCGAAGPVSIENLAFVIDPTLQALIGAEGAEGEPPAEPPLLLSDLRGPSEPPIDAAAFSTKIKALDIGQGRAMATIRATLDRLREIQKANQGTTLEEIPEAAALLEVLRRLPHGVITIADSNNVLVTQCLLKSREPQPTSAGAFVTGTCENLEISGCRIEAVTGVLAAPLATAFSNAYLTKYPVAGLALRDLCVRSNDIFGRGAAAVGARVADGALDGVRIEDNLVAGFAIGIEVDDRLALSKRAAGRLLINDNRVIEGTVAGILAAGDGLDIAGNEIRPAETNDHSVSSGMFHAGIQITGQHIRVRSSWITLPPTPNAPVLGVLAGIVIGDGLDDGKRIPRAVFDVEITGNRIEGAGASTRASGVLIGGPQAIYNVRLRDNVVQNLGDAAVRVHGTGSVGDVVIEDNRIQEVALIELPATSNTLVAQLAKLAPSLSVPAATADPDALLTVALANGTSAARPALDAALRWVEKVTLRGAIVLSRAEDTLVRNNQIHGVGRFEHLAGARPLGDKIRTAAVGLVGGHDVTIEGNRVEGVRAPITLKSIVPGIFVPKRPLAFSALENLDLLLKTGARSEQTDLHAAAASLLHRTLEYGMFVDRRPNLGRSVYVALDALTEALDAIEEPQLAGGLRTWTGALRAGQSENENTRTAAEITLLLSQVARVTTAVPRAKDAYMAFEKALAALVAEHVEQLGDVLTDLPDLLADVPHTKSVEITDLLNNPSQDHPEAILPALLWLGSFRDEEARKSLLGLGEAKGFRRDIVTSLARSLRDRAGSLVNANNAVQLVGWMRSDIRGLSQMLRESGSHHASYIENDFAEIDRKDPDVSETTVGRFKDTVLRVLAWAGAEGESTPQEDQDAEAAVRAADARGLASIRFLAVDFVESQVGLLSELDPSTDVLGDAALQLLLGEMRQLNALVEDDRALDAQCIAARASVTDAIGAANTFTRAARIREARSAFTRMRGLLAAVLTTAAGTFIAKPTPATPQRLSGMVASILALRDLRGQTQLVTDGLDLLDTHVRRGVDEAGVPLATREVANDALATARSALLDQSHSADVDQRIDDALSSLADVFEQVTSAAAPYVVSPEMSATAVLARATHLGLQTTGTEAERVSSVHAYLSSRKIELSAGVHAKLTGQTDLGKLLSHLREALEGIAALHSVTPSLAPDPDFGTLPDPADGVLACSVAGSVRIDGNHIESALTGASVTGGRGHVLAEANFAAPSAVHICDNEISGCGAGALDLLPAGSAIVTIEGNRFTGCADLAAADNAAGRNGAVAPVSSIGQSVVRVAGQGELFLLQNLFYENGNDNADHLLHEVYVDFRGDVVVRGNTIRHGGGGLGGVGLLLVVETLDANAAKAGELVRKLSQSPALSVDRPATRASLSSLIGRVPWRPLAEPHVPSSPRVVTTPLYVARAELGPSSKLVHFVRGRPPIVLLARPLTQRRSVHIEGNRVHAAGPALLLLGSGAAIITATVSGNELVSDQPNGAVYLRHTDATVFTANHATCTRAVNVVVLKPDAAPVAISGNIILGAQAAPPSNRVAAIRQDLLKRYVSQKLDALKGALPDFGPILRDDMNLGVQKVSIYTRTNARATGYGLPFTSYPGVRLGDLTNVEIPAGLRPLLTPGSPTEQVPARPNPYAHSLVVIGGTHVVSIGNSTTAGSIIHDADDAEERNI